MCQSSYVRSFKTNSTDARRNDKIQENYENDGGLPPAVFLLAQVLCEVLGHVLELRDVVGIEFHQGLMRFEAGAGHFFAISLRDRLFDALHRLRRRLSVNN